MPQVRVLSPRCAGVAQLVEQLICNQQVRGSSPFTSSQLNMEEFPSGQRGQTVNLLLSASVVRIHPLPPTLFPAFSCRKFFMQKFFGNIISTFHRLKRFMASFTNELVIF